MAIKKCKYLGSSDSSFPLIPSLLHWCLLTHCGVAGVYATKANSAGLKKKCLQDFKTFLMPTKYTKQKQRIHYSWWKEELLSIILWIIIKNRTKHKSPINWV